MKILTTKVGGVEEELARKVYKIPICAVYGKPEQTIQAVGIPQISNEVEEVDNCAGENVWHCGKRSSKEGWPDRTTSWH